MGQQRLRRATKTEPNRTKIPVRMIPNDLYPVKAFASCDVPSVSSLDHLRCNAEERFDLGPHWLWLNCMNTIRVRAY